MTLKHSSVNPIPIHSRMQFSNHVWLYTNQTM